MEKLNKDDFVEILYTARIKDNGIFDTNIEEEAKKLKLEIKTNPLVICLGQNMILKAIDDFLIGKELGDYLIELEPEKAFGSRNRALIKTMPLSVFYNHNIKPEQGMVFSFDNLLGKITAVSGGRVIVDFNNPAAGRVVVYELKVKRKIINQEEKIKALILIFFRKELKFEVKENKLIIEADKNLEKFILLFKEKFKEILNLEIETKEAKEKVKEAEEKSEEKKEGYKKQEKISTF